MGRLVADPDVRYGTNNNCVARYRLAVDRKFKREGEQDADFINCVAFGKSGEFAAKYLHKGTKLCVIGRIQTGSYEKDGQKIYTTDVVIEEHNFCESKLNNMESCTQNPQSSVDNNGFMKLPDGIDEELPFV